MPKGPVGGPRPSANSVLRLSIKETPVPESDPQGVFPEKLLRTGAYEEDIVEDIADRTTFDEDDIGVDRRTKFKRGLGQTEIYTIRIDVNKDKPKEVNRNVDKLGSAGYLFESVFFE